MNFNLSNPWKTSEYALCKELINRYWNLIYMSWEHFKIFISGMYILLKKKINIKNIVPIKNSPCVKSGIRQTVLRLRSLNYIFAIVVFTAACVSHREYP